MRDMVRRALRVRSGTGNNAASARAVQSRRRKAEFLQSLPKGSTLFRLLARPCAIRNPARSRRYTLAARAVLRNCIRPNELEWLYRLLRFQKPNEKRDELTRIVERALEGRKGNVRKSQLKRLSRPPWSTQW